jgi:hypothetical protein
MLELLVAGAALAGGTLGCTNAGRESAPVSQTIQAPDPYGRAQTKVNELELRLKDAPKDAELLRQASDAYFSLAEHCLQSQQYEKTAAHAARALELTYAGRDHEGVNERIAGCHELLGLASIRQNDAVKGLEYLRKGFNWSKDAQQNRIAREIFAVYRDNGLLEVTREFSGSVRLKTALLAEIHAYHVALTEEKKSVVITVRSDTDLKRVAWLYGNLAEYVLVTESKKPAEGRNPAHNLEYYFRAVIFGYQVANAQERLTLVKKIVNDYALTKKVYPSLPSLQESFKTWHGKHAAKTLPASAELLDALQKLREF